MIILDTLFLCQTPCFGVLESFSGSSDPSEGDEQDKWALGGQGQFQEVIL